MLSEELVAAFLIGFALGASIRNEQLNKATEQRDRAENMLRNVSKEYAEIAMDCVNAMDRADKCQRELEKIREEHATPEELAEELDTLGDYAYSYRIGDSVMGMTVKSYGNLMSAAARCLRKGADNAGKK